ncbi:MAG: transglycosylase SLT domain-containing protein [Desulfobacterales bacterium]|nr:transglycosylase SLT domain-containing protein [Desulfobacterales bacterium]
MNRFYRYPGRVVFLIFLLWALPAASGAEPASISSAEIPALAAALNHIPPVDFCGEPVPLKNPDVRERFEKEMLLLLWNRPQVILWMKRAGRYLPVIEEILAEHRIPADLKYIAVIESALRPHAGSSRGAVGFWQFMAETGRNYGLTVDARKDERRNIYDSTRAVARYFSHLYDRFGSWTLAAAAFNMGEAGLEAEIAEQQVNNYYDLYLSLETQRYVLRAVSAKIILSAPERYGFGLAVENAYPPLSFARVLIECREETPIRLAAQAAGTSFKRIKDLNPEIRGHYLAAGSHWLRIPEPVPDGFQDRVEELFETHAAERKQHIYIVRNGDNLSVLAERFGVPLLSLLIWNRIDPSRPIHPGDRLVVHPPAPVENARNGGEVEPARGGEEGEER